MPDPTSVIPASNPSKATATAKLQLHELHYNLGSILHQQGDLVGAAQNYQQTIALHPHHAIAHHHLAIVLDEQGQRDQAIDHYTQAIALRPASAELYNNLACALAKQGRVDEAIQAYEQAIALQPQWAKLYHNLAQVEYQRHPMVAIAHYRQAIALQPDFVAAHYHLGKSLQFQGQHAAAVACFQKVLALAPEHPYAQSDCGFSWMQQGQIETALICFRASIAQQPLMVQAYCDWAKGLTGTDELSLARVACGEFLQALLQQNSEVYDRLADTYFHLGNVLLLYGGTEQVHQAEIYYQKALHLQPERIDLYLKLADCLIHQKRCNAAILVYHTAIALQPQPRLYLQLGQVLEQNQELMGAIAYYRQALLAKGQAGSWKYMQLTSTKSLHPEWKEHPDRLNLDQNAPKIPAIPSQPPSPQPEPSSSIQHFYASTQDWFQAQGLAASDYCALRSRPLTPDSAASGLENIPSSSQPGEMPAPQCLQPLESPQTASCQGLNCASCLPKIFREFQPIHVGAGIYRCTPHTPPISRTPPLFTATIPQGKAWAVPQQNDWMICNAIAVLTPENHLLADVSRDYPGQLPGCENPGTHRAFRQTWTEAPEAIAGKVAVVAGLSGHNYFHWMVDILPRLEILRQSHWDWDAIDWFWINDDHRRFQQQTLQA
ncbi:MAG: tetratricopeptide repeat protein, partial [Oculatellaceae cyanobacterium Prado106]|nr:tetratricopeptide repeat protein [Oculatellaceae cyanobacterium Prado106]